MIKDRQYTSNQMFNRRKFPREDRRVLRLKGPVDDGIQE